MTHGMAFSNLENISGYSIMLCKKELCVEIICKTIKPIQVTHIILLHLLVYIEPMYRGPSRGPCPTSLSRPSFPALSMALRPLTRLRPLDLDPGLTHPTPSLVLLSPARPGVGEAEGVVGGGDVVVVLGALRTRLQLPLLLLALEVCPGHPSAPHGQGAS